MRSFVLTLLLLFSLLLTSCSRQERMPGYLYQRLSSDPTTLDPALIVDVSGGSISAKLYNGLVTFAEDASIVPDLAEHIDLSSDGRTYTFRLKAGVTFSNGREVTSADFKYSFERVLAKATKSPRTWLFDRIVGAKEFMDGKAAGVAGIETPDPHTLKITLVAPFGPFLGLLAMPGGYVIPREDVERLGPDFSDHPVGTGPYTLTGWKHGDSLVLKANPGYNGEKPGLAGISYRVIPEDLTAVAEFERGGLDSLAVPAPEYRRYTGDARWKDLVVSRVGMNTYYMGLNCGRPPFDNPLVRRAVSAAIDRKRILDTIYEGRGLLARGPVPQSLMTQDISPEAYDPAAARRLLAESGHKDGLSVKIYIGAEQETLDMVEVIQQYLAAVGIKASIVQLEWSAYKQAVNNGDADAFWLSWQADYPDPENFLFPVFYSGNFGSAGNRARFKDPEFDALITKAQAEPDGNKRLELYRAAQSRVVAQAPWVFFWHKMDVVVRQPWVKGLRLYPINNADKGLGISISR